MDWEINGLTGTEIYNTHANFSDKKKPAAKLKSPLGMFQLMERFRNYPQEAFGALQDYPAGYLRKWDELCQQNPHTGVAAPDSHQNVGLFVRLLDDGNVRLEVALGEQLNGSGPSQTPSTFVPTVRNSCSWPGRCRPSSAHRAVVVKVNATLTLDSVRIVIEVRLDWCSTTLQREAADRLWR